MKTKFEEFGHYVIYFVESIFRECTIQKDGNQWCFLYGEDLQSGISGFGDTPQDALKDFIENMEKENE
ncbi:hypothetical protein KC799_20695 [candidate division KSB1 bacterium]|nr:hypothetical protein [candidate division KSB1 bacterium]